MQQKYIPAQLDLLYEAIQEQAELDVQEALQREFPDETEAEHNSLLTHWRRLCAKAEARLAEQGE